MSKSKVDQEADNANFGMSTRVLLARNGLEDYSILFERAGYKLLDGRLRFSDAQVDLLLSDVETFCNVKLLPEIRCRLWKAFRVAWSQGAGHGRPAFVDKDNVPALFLPKRYYVPVDQMLNLDDLDPDRQRQILRKKKQMPPSSGAGQTGPVFQTLQFEVYKRKNDLWYLYKDLLRSVEEWVSLNPMTMVREDRREDVLKCRIQLIMNDASKLLDRRLQRYKWTVRMANIMYGVCSFFLVATVCLVAAAFYKYRTSPFVIMLDFVLGSKQLICAMSYLLAFFVVYIVAIRSHTDPMIGRLNKIIVGCARMKEMIDEFRIETDEMRMMKEEARLREKRRRAQMPKTMSIGMTIEDKPDEDEDEMRERKKKKNKKTSKEPEKEVDKLMMHWAPDFEQGKLEFDPRKIQQDLEDSLALLPQLNVRAGREDRNIKYQREPFDAGTFCRLGNNNNREEQVFAHLPVDDMPRLAPDWPRIPPPTFDHIKRRPRMPKVPPPPSKATKKKHGIPPDPRLPEPPKEPLKVEVKHDTLGECFDQRTLAEGVEGWMDCDLQLTNIPADLAGALFFAFPHGSVPEGTLTLTSNALGTVFVWCDVEQNGGISLQGWELFGTMDWGPEGQKLEIYSFPIPGTRVTSWPILEGWIGGVAFKRKEKKVAKSKAEGKKRPKGKPRRKRRQSLEEEQEEDDEDDGEEQEESEEEEPPPPPEPVEDSDSTDGSGSWEGVMRSGAPTRRTTFQQKWLAQLEAGAMDDNEGSEEEGSAAPSEGEGGESPRQPLLPS